MILEQEDVADELKDGRVDLRPAAPCAGHGLIDDVAVLRQDRDARLQVGPIDREAGDHFTEHPAQVVDREVAALPVALGGPVQLPRQGGQLTGQEPVLDQQLARVEDLGDRLLIPGELAVGRVDLVRARGIDEHPVERVEVLVADRAIDWPVLRERLAAAEDLLGEEREPPVQRRRRVVGDCRAIPLAERRHDLLPVPAPALGVEPLAARPEEEPFLDPPEIPERVRQTVGMVDSEPRHTSLAGPSEDQRVGQVEDLRVLRPQAGQLVDVEEPAIVDLLRGDPPIGQPVDLVLQQLVQRVEAPGVSLGPPERRDVLVEEFAEPGALRRGERPDA